MQARQKDVRIYVMGCILATFKPGSSCEEQGISHSNLSKGRSVCMDEVEIDGHCHDPKRCAEMSTRHRGSCASRCIHER